MSETRCPWCPPGPYAGTATTSLYRDGRVRRACEFHARGLSQQRKVCVYVAAGESGCGRLVDPLGRGDDFGSDERILRWSHWRCLPQRAQCDGCIEHLRTPEGQRRLEPFVGFTPDTACASRDHILSAALFCGALAGCLDARLRALLDDVIRSGDALALLDEAELRGLDGQDAQWPEERQEWLEVDKHGDPGGNNPHVWLPYVSGDLQCGWPAARCSQPATVSCTRSHGARLAVCDAHAQRIRDVTTAGLVVVAPLRRCTCGTFEHEINCYDANCQRESGHPGLHMRSAIHGYGGLEEQIDEWGDVDAHAADIIQRYVDGDPHVLL